MRPTLATLAVNPLALSAVALAPLCLASLPSTARAEDPAGPVPLVAEPAPAGSSASTVPVPEVVTAPDAEAAYPARFVDRPINLRRGMVQVDARYQAVVVDGLDPVHSLGFGGSIGLTDRAQLMVTHERGPGIDSAFSGGLVMAAGDTAASGRNRFGALTLAGRYALSQQEDFDLSVEVGVAVPIALRAPFAVALGVPVRARLAERFALDLLPTIELVVYEAGARPEGDAAELSLVVPISGVLSITDRVFLAGRSGLAWQLTADAGMFEAFSFPLLLELGGTVLANDVVPALDVSVEAGFPSFLRPSADDAVGTDVLLVRANLTVALRP